MKYGKMMKGIGVAALALTVVSSCIVGGTLAKYTTTATGNGSAVVAKWAPGFKDGDGDAFTDSTVINLKDLVVDEKKVADGKIAPGTSGSFAVQVASTDVGFTYMVTISDMDKMPKNFKLYEEDGTTELTATDGVYTLTPQDNTMDAGSGVDKTITVKWKWPYEADGADKTANDAEDTADGEAGDTMTFKVNITATQVATR